jgi:transposase
MELMSRSSRFSPEQKSRAVRMVLEGQVEYSSQWAAIESAAAKIGASAETLRKWVRQAEVDGGHRAGLSTKEAAEIKRLKREVAELRRANEILKAAAACVSRMRRKVAMRPNLHLPHSTAFR